MSLAERFFFEHLTNSHCELINFQSNDSECFITFTIKTHFDDRFYKKKKKETFEERFHTVIYHIELYDDALTINFNGKELPDQIRYLSTLLLQEIIYSLRFKFKNRDWITSRFTLFDLDEYSKRTNIEFSNSIAIELHKIWNDIFKEIDEHDHLPDEDVHHLAFYITGKDGLSLCKALKDYGLIGYEQKDLNLFELKLVDQSIALSKQFLFLETLTEELHAVGYSTWIDYPDDH